MALATEPGDTDKLSAERWPPPQQLFYGCYRLINFSGRTQLVTLATVTKKAEKLAKFRVSNKAAGNSTIILEISQ